MVTEPTPEAARVRAAREEDIPALLRLLRQVCRVHHEGRPDLFRETGTKYGADELRRMISSPESPILIAADERDEAVGYAICFLQEHQGESAMVDNRTLYLDDLCVDEARRGAHIGSLLYRAATDLARALHCHNLTLNAWACNEGALAFYRAMGMQVQKYGMEVLL